MGSSVSLTILSQFMVNDENKAKEIAREICKFNEDEDSSEIDSLYSYIDTPYDINSHVVNLTLLPHCYDDSYESITIGEGNFGLYYSVYDSYLEYNKIEDIKKQLEIISEDIKNRYGIDFEIFIIGTFG